jgi:hypothetical protein
MNLKIASKTSFSVVPLVATPLGWIGPKWQVEYLQIFIDLLLLTTTYDY